MIDGHEVRIRTAAVAGWWTLLVAFGIFIISWLAYIIVAPAQPKFVLALWGPGADWERVQSLWFWFLAGFKVLLAIIALILLWLTLWARQLRRESATRM